MKAVVILCAVISFGSTAPVQDESQAKTLSYKNGFDPIGNYEFSFETSNGITRQETGRLVNVGQPDEHLIVQGSYTYLDPEGKLVTVNYTADENGYRTDNGLTLPDFQQEFPPPVVVSAPLPGAAVATLLG